LRERTSPADKLAEAVAAPFTETEFDCYVKDVRHTPDGEMQVILRIPATELLKAIKVVKTFHRTVVCRMQAQ
jgi:hypothetical protein